ncbi:hypothetical protein PspLS_06117 [Pyricularia sp. CBS 133598]|nr:hypothetical protein PspLS_06117 [Pyricularia sp. CBS 133598]
MQLKIEKSSAWTPSTQPSAFASVQPRPIVNITGSLPQSHGGQEQQRPSKRPCVQSICYDQGLVQPNAAREAVEAFGTTLLTESSTAVHHGAMLHNLSSLSKPTPFTVTESLQVHEKSYLQPSSPTVNSDAASGAMNGELIQRSGNKVLDRDTQGHHSHIAAVIHSSASSPHVYQPSGSGRTSLSAANETQHNKVAAVDIEGDELGALHRAPQDNGVLPSDFDLDSEMEDDMGKLVDGDFSIEPHQTPPLSVQEIMDRQSRDADEYDPRLRRSPQVNRDEGSNSRHGRGGSNEQDCDILDYEVDWDEVMASIKPHACNIHEDSRPQPVLQHGHIHEPMSISTGLKSTNQNMINAQRAVFELFARVTYSSREPYARVQHFQFADLYKDYPPFLSGTMRNWKLDSLVDRQAQEFLGEGGPRFCRCTCQLQKGINTDTGWVISILSIRLSDEDEADSMRRMTF